MELSWFVLVLQIGFNAALNNRGYNSNSMIPSPRFVNSGHTRRFPEVETHVPLSTRGIPGSDEHSDSEYSTSFEDYSYRRVKPLQSRPNQRRNGYLRYNTRPENYVGLEKVPVGRINSNNNAESFQPSSSSRRWTNTYYRRPNSSPSNLRQGQTRKYNRETIDDSSLEVSSLESSKPEDSSRLGEEANYLRSLLSLIERPNNRRGQSRKYYKQGNSLSVDVSPIDKLDLDEDAVSSPNFLNKRRNYKHQDGLRYGEPSPTKDVTDDYLDKIAIVTDEDKPNGLPKLQSPEQVRSVTGLGNNHLYTRRNGDGLNINDNNSGSHLSYRRLKPRPDLKNDSTVTRKLNRNSNDNPSLESELNDNTEKLTVLHLEDLNIKPSELRNGNNRTNNHRNFLRLSLSPNNKVALDEGVASDLSELVSDTLDELNVAPVNFRRNGPSNTKNSRKKNNRPRAEKDNISDPSVLRLGRLNIPKAASPLQRNREPANRRSHINKRAHGDDTRQIPKKVFDEDTAKTLVPYHEGKTIELINNRRDKKENNTGRDDGFSDEFSLDTLFDFRKKANLSSNDKLISKDTTDTLHLEFPWNNQLSPGNEKGSKISAQPGLRSKSKSKSPEQKKDAKDTTGILHLEFPWNGPLGSDSDKSKSKLKSDEKKDKPKDTTDTLLLEYPWNDALSPNSSKGKSKLRINKEKNQTESTSDTLHLEFPWNGELSSESEKDKSKLRTDENKNHTKDTTDVLHLEFPWNDALGPEDDKRKPQLRNKGQKETKKDTTDTLHLEFPRNGELSSESDENKSKLKTDEEKDSFKDSTDTLELEFPWNDALSPDSDKSKQLRSEDSKKDTADSLHLEFPWNDQLSTEETKTGKFKTKSLLRSQTDDRQDKEPKDELKLEFPWTEKINPDKPSSKKTAVRTPDPFFIHPYLRSRNINKHPNYYRRSDDGASESLRLDHLKPSPSESLIRLGEVGLAREGSRESDEDPSEIIIFPSERRHQRV